MEGFSMSGLKSPESLKKQKEANNSEEISIRDEIFFPHVNAILSLLNKEFKEENIDQEVVKDILWEFIEQRINRAQLYSSESHKVTFPYGMTDTAELAKKLYSRYTGQELNQNQLEKNQTKKKKEFVFTSVPPVQSLSAGSIFAFMEEAMHQAISDIPKAIEMLRAGKEPNAHEIYNLGSPTNELGTMSKEFLDKLKGNKAFEEFGALYSEFIESIVPPEERKNTDLFLYGQSTGASFASETGECLLKNKAVTQLQEDKNNLSFMQIRLDTPVGSSDIPKARKKWQIPLGFLVDATFTLITDKYLKPVMKKDKQFLTSAQKLLTKKGLPPQLSEEQVAFKKQGAWEVLENLRNGTPIPEDLKVIKVIGGNDILMWSGDMREEMKTQEKEHSDSLGQNLISKDQKQKIFGIRSMRHSMPYFRPSELRRLVRASRVLSSVKSK
jgi:hypothetical protein